MLSGAGSQARDPDATSPGQADHISLPEPLVEGPRKEVHGEGQASYPSWAAQSGQEEAEVSPGLLSTPEPLSMGSRAAVASLAHLDHWREARLPFSRFLDEVTVRVLYPGTLEAFRGTRDHSREPSPGAWGPSLAQEPLLGTSAPEEKAQALSPQLSLEAAAEAVSRMGPGPAVGISGPHVGSGQHGGRTAATRRLPGPVSLSPSVSPQQAAGQRSTVAPSLVSTCTSPYSLVCHSA
ncbi:uncharacterized protein LOC143651827 [Tamandua tetradactyla]|uniref:uncharacterized protein LOC143651827 n=1 Tax=Tamandua tetradactyla TaxID=48850 RepID=UPI00405422A9